MTPAGPAVARALAPPGLVVDGVSKSFGGLVAVDDVSLEVEPGTITAMIGPNGAGKTTLFNVVTRFEDADRGRLRFDGQDISTLRPWQVARLGMVRSFQTPVGFPNLSVWENLMVGGSERWAEGLGAAFLGRRRWLSSERNTAARAEEVLNDLGLWEHRDGLLEDLSPGDVKLVDFARQLMAQPRMLLLDEPASGVDPSSIGRLGDLLRRLRDRGITILIIDHNIGFVLSIAQYVHVLAEGRLVAQGTPEAVAADPRVIEIYLGTPVEARGSTGR